MTFGRWLLIHSFSIFIVVMFILGYVYREELQLQQAYQQLLNLDPVQVVNRPGSEVEHESNKAEASKKTSPQRIESSTPTVIETAQPTRPAAVIQSIPTVSEPDYQLDERLFLARKAYWNKSYEDSIALYRQLIDVDPGNPDYLGELGNVYYVLNDYYNASRAYYRAAILLKDQGESDRAGMLVSPLTAMDREMGDRLRQQLQR